MKLRNAATKPGQKSVARSVPVIGIDIGQQRDPTAIAVAEIAYRTPETALGNDPSKKESHFLVRHLERLPLGTPYPQVARRLCEICQSVNQRCGQRPEVFVDATGVGKPIVDILEASSPEAHLWSVIFTHGDRRTENRHERRVTLGKAHLVSRLQALLQCGRLHLPATAEARALAKELLDYEIRVDENAHARYGAFRVGTHDDLVTAIGLAVQKEPTISAYAGQALSNR